MRLTIATRQSQLALWQAEWVQDLLSQHPEVKSVELLPLVSRGDKILDAPLAKVGGKGLFVKELEEAMLEGAADLAVHSMKDVPMAFPKGLSLSAILERASPFDALVSNDYAAFADLPKNAVVGTSSLRRQAQLLRQRPDLDIRFLRGNVNTRLAKLDKGEYQAIILAEAGLIRLGFGDRIAHALDPELILPAAGQGAVGIETRTSSSPRDSKIQSIVRSLQHTPTALSVLAERGVITRLNGGCQVPIGAFCQISPSKHADHTHTLSLQALVCDETGQQIISANDQLNCAQESQAFDLGYKLGGMLIDNGADKILAKYGMNV